VVTLSARTLGRRWTVVGGAVAALMLGSVAARAYYPIDGWVHDHSSAGIPPRPSGYTELVQTFGKPCSNAANDSRSYWPSQSARNVSGYVYYHPYIARDVGYNIRNHIAHDHRDGAVDYLVGAYNCRTIRGSTDWSVHAFGAAVDTNSARNPLGQDHWNGKGADGTDYGRYLPDVWRGAFPGHHFFWGLNWDSRPDPMHFQYVTDY
jgi:D-alanyl-D-alanine carboxypeptidase